MILRHLKTYFAPGQKLTKEITLALLSIFTYALGYASIMFLPLYLKHSLDYSLQQTGIVLSIFGVGFIIGSFFGGTLCDKFSSYTISFISIVSYLVLTVIVYFLRQPEWLVTIILSIFGCATAVFSSAVRIYLMNLTQPQERVHMNSIRYMLFNIGCAISYGIAGLLAYENYRNIFILSAISGIATLVILLPLKEKQLKSNKASNKIKTSIWKEKFLLISLVSFFLGTLVFNQTGSSYSLFLSAHYHLASHALGMLFLVNSLIIAVFQVGLLNLLSKFPQFLLMSTGSIILGIGFFVLLFDQSFFLALISMIIITLGEMLFMPVSYTLIFQNAKEEVRGFCMGIYQALSASTFILSPLIGTFALDHNPSGVLLWAGSLLICFFPLLIYFFFIKNKTLYS
ncbi:MAG: hypothetical protein A3E87_10635 [Gammaproteobacteria bacterium RIFCSPHIGHO2_12_FULL_35_23]|nr:MAG: hypothetical protein A3E87_10635 [Gammaproteobacteria bacterium RIFCSPHIGHO2_12_FULL_35_23]